MTPSVIALALTNLAILVQAIVMGWGPGTLIWTYWMQGLVIVIIAFVFAKQKSGFVFLTALLGFYAVFLLALTFPSETASYTINGSPVTADRFTVLKDVIWPAVWINTLLLAVNHTFSYIMNSRDGSDKKTFSKIMLRVMPLHAIIVFVAVIPFPVVVFIVLKTIADIRAHVMEHGAQFLTR